MSIQSRIEHTARSVADITATSHQQPPVDERTARRGLHLIVALVIGLAMWVGIIAAAPVVYDFVVGLFRPL
jgi:hypothetical protein